MRTPWRFRRGFLPALLPCALMTMLVALASCGSEASDGGAASNEGAAKDSGLDELSTLCGKQSSPLLRGLRANPPVDFIASRHESMPYPEYSDAQSPDGHDAWFASISDEIGTKCATATDKASCESNVDQYRLLPEDVDQCGNSFGGSLSGCFVDYYLYTRGDDVAAARTDDEIRSLVGMVENIDEALILASNIAGLRLNCPGYPPEYPSYVEELPTSQFRVDGEGGFELHLIKPRECGTSTKDCVVHVARNGDMSQSSCTDFPLGDKGCE